MKRVCVAILAILANPLAADPLSSVFRKDFSKRGFTTSQFEWTLTWVGGRDDGLVERHVTRQAGDDLWESNLGDENGHHPTMYRAMPGADSPPQDPREFEWPAERIAGTRNSLTHDGRVWYLPRVEHSVMGFVEDAETSSSHLPFDFSLAGFAPVWHGLENSNALRLNQRLLAGLDRADVHEGQADGLRTVTAAYGDRQLVWYLDDEVGRNPVRAEFYDGGELRYSSETVYREAGDRWVVESMRFYNDYDESPSQIIDVQSASFDQPDHLKAFLPSDVGARIGTQFQSKQGRFCWAGSELVPEETYFEMVFVFGLRPDPEIVERLATSVDRTVEEYLAGLEITSESMRNAYFAKHGERPWLDDVVLLKPGEKDEWDVYVEKFIKEHKLTGDPANRAKDVLERSKRLRDARLRKNAPKIREAKREGDKKKLEYYDAITKRIFDEVLVRSLNRLVPKSAGKTQTAKVAGNE